MSARPTELTAALHDYLQANGVREPEPLVRLREETASHQWAIMQISPEQGALMALLAELLDARRYLEVGVFTGYSALAVALALPADGRVTACDINPEWTDVARRYWKEAGVEDRIELRMGSALETLDALLAEGLADAYDFAFIDADKENNDGYYERALRLVRPGGLIAVDNMLWHGRVADPAQDDPNTNAIRALNAKLRDDERVSPSLVPIGDGMMLARRRV